VERSQHSKDEPTHTIVDNSGASKGGSFVYDGSPYKGRIPFHPFHTGNPFARVVEHVEL